MNKLDKLKDIIIDSFIDKHFKKSDFFNEVLFTYHYKSYDNRDATSVIIFSPSYATNAHYEVKRLIEDYFYSVSSINVEPIIDKLYREMLDKVFEKYFPNHLEV